MKEDYNFINKTKKDNNNETFLKTSVKGENTKADN